LNNAGAQAVDHIHRHELAVIITAGVALAASGQPEPWQLGLQKGATPVMDDIIWFHDFLLWVISAITLFVLALLVIVVGNSTPGATRSPRERPTTPP
jgi:heme/copper-type cytochrome/quinol oxidase subunit 2